MLDVQRRFISKTKNKEEIIRGNLAEFLWRGLDCIQSIFQAVLSFSYYAKNFPYSLITAFPFMLHFSNSKKKKYPLFLMVQSREVGIHKIFVGSCCITHSLTPFFGEAPSRSTDFSLLVPRSRSTHREPFDCFLSSSAVVLRHHSEHFQQFLFLLNNFFFINEQKVL